MKDLPSTMTTGFRGDIPIRLVIIVALSFFDWCIISSWDAVKLADSVSSQPNYHYLKSITGNITALHCALLITSSVILLCLVFSNFTIQANPLRFYRTWRLFGIIPVGRRYYSKNNYVGVRIYQYEIVSVETAQYHGGLDKVTRHTVTDVGLVSRNSGIMRFPHTEKCEEFAKRLAELAKVPILERSYSKPPI
jgi:hypothetical protein